MTDTKKREKARKAPTYAPGVGETAHLNLSPTGFRLWAKQYYECRLSFQCPGFSPVPYFLLCRAIELQFKAVHLEQKRQKEVKDLYGHSLIRSYNALPATYKKLSPEQLSLLEQANKIYSGGEGFDGKGFEYFDIRVAAAGFFKIPNLQALDELAKAVMTAPPFVQPGA
jgi:hypothetical protein